MPPNVVGMTSRNARRYAPTTAPDRLPKPPMTAAMNALSTGVKPRNGIHLARLGGVQVPSHGRQTGRDGERDHHHPVDPDAHQPRRGQVLGDGLHREPQAGPGHEQGQQQEQDGRR